MVYLSTFIFPSPCRLYSPPATEKFEPIGPFYSYRHPPLPGKASCHVSLPLQRHPQQGRRADNKGTRAASAPGDGAPKRPLLDEMQPGDGEGPNCQAVNLGVGGMVGGVEAHDGR